MSDIARLAGVSVGSVSRALNGSPEIGEETRQRIVELARSLNYTVNVGARNLRRGHNRTIAVIAPFLPSDTQRLTDPFLWGLIGAIAEELTANGYQMLLYRMDSTKMEIADPVETGAAAGLIVTGQWLSHDKANALAIARVPFAMWGAERPRQLYCTVSSDNLFGGRCATEHLLGLGKRRIAFVGDTRTDEIRLRHEGYLAAHRAHGVAPDPRLELHSMFDNVVLRRELTELLDADIGFDAVFAAGDMAAIEVMRLLQKRGRRIPEDVSVVGYDDIAVADLVTPALTTVRQPLADAGKALVDAVMSQIQEKTVAPRVLSTSLVVRSSTA
ncbi:MAG TPA: substrate-binding domain-containing protein [Dyella sp.]|uniref:LacI family DNA-binding transcriptional regulator n=1 Tax=Dyella sp. TaxID=1869338 RepID=UPI002F91C15A